MKLLIVHGGTDRPQSPPYLYGVKQAAIKGYQYLGTDILTAVEKAVNCLEDDPLFNAGYGAVLNRDGEAELDAAIVDGSVQRCGVVTAVKGIKNPVSLARLVMERTIHHVLSGDGAVNFAREQGFIEHDLVTPDSRAQWQQELNKTSQSADVGGTVGCLIIADGKTAAASSTGGQVLKLPGRVGDSGVLGAGIWANRYGAALCTGSGEAFISCLSASRALNLVAQGINVSDAARRVIQEVTLVGGRGALVLADANGSLAVMNNQPELPLALIVDGQYIEGYMAEQW